MTKKIIRTLEDGYKYSKYASKEEFIEKNSMIVEENVFAETGETIINILENYSVSSEDLEDNPNIMTGIKKAINYFKGNSDEYFYSLDYEFRKYIENYTDIETHMDFFLESYNELITLEEVIEHYGKDWELDIILENIRSDHDFEFVEYEPIFIKSYGSNVQIFKGDSIVKTVYKDDFLISDCLELETLEAIDEYKNDIIKDIIDKINDNEEGLQKLTSDDEEKIKFQLSLLAGL